MIDESSVDVLTLDASKPPEELAEEAVAWVEHKFFENGLVRF